MSAHRSSRHMKEPRVSLNSWATMFFLFWFAITTVFLLGHVFLRFTTKDLKIEACRLQAQAERLRIQEKNLLWEIESLKQGDRLHEFAARDLGLVDADPVAIERLVVPACVIARYEQGCATDGYEHVQWAQARYPGGIKADVDSFVQINRELMAREDTLDAELRKAEALKIKDSKGSSLLLKKSGDEQSKLRGSSIRKTDK
ncbi:MAG TPA: hypothetical protein PLB62_02295 [Candidatus Sumerlaeota bacterium]|nr:hypothetical protein [Candidatus Sumerlaeota bacterium]